jgi:pectin methylesterase-like acyl-CoA thioesterase
MLLLFQQDFVSTDTIVLQHNLNTDVEIRIVDDTNTINNNLVDTIEFDSVDPYNKLTVYLKSSTSGRVQLMSSDAVIVTARDKTKIAEVQTIKDRVTNLLSTGILTGGELSINSSDHTKFDIAAGTGIVVDNYTDPLNPTIIVVEWTEKTALVDSYLSSVNETSIAIDKDGYIIQSDTYYLEEQRRDLIVLGDLGHLQRTEIEYVIVEPEVIFDVVAQLNDFFENFGSFNISGNIFEPNGPNLYLNKTSGKTFDNGTNYVNTKKSPNVFISDEYIAPYLQYYNRDADGYWVSADYTQSVIVDKYDSGTGLADVPSGKWTIQTIFLYAPTETIDIQFGQTYYDSLLGAEVYLSEFIDINPFLSCDTFRGWLIVKEGATELDDLSQAKFIPSVGLGMFYSAAGTGVSGNTAASNIGLSGVGIYDGKEEITLQFRNIDSESNKISVSLDDVNHTVDLDVIEGYLSHQNLSGAGTNTHSAIDSHISSTLNPHSVTATQVGNSVAQWNADKLEGYAIATTGPTNGQVLAWDNAISKYKPVTGAVHGRVIVVSLSGGDFTSIKAAVDSITDASIVNPYVVKVEPGVYSEDPFTLKSFIGVIGQGDEFWGVSIVTTNNSAHFITGAAGASLQRVSVTGPSGTGYAAIDYSATSPIPFEVRDILIRKGYYGLYCHPSGFGMINAFSIVPTYIGSSMNKFIYVTDYGRVACFSCACAGPPPYTVAYGFYIDGANTDVSLDLCTFGIVGCVGAFANNGAKLRANACSFTLGSNAFECGSGGTNTRMFVSGTTIGEDFTYDFKINTSTSVVSFNGVGHRDKLLVPADTNFSASFTDPTDGYQGQVVLGELWFGTTEHSFPLGSYSKNIASTGIMSGGGISILSGLTIDVIEGYGYVNDGIKVYDVKWPNTELELTSNTEQGWIIIDKYNTVSETFVSPDDTQVIVLGTFSTGASSTYYLSEVFVVLPQYIPKMHIYTKDVVGPISVSGTVATKHAATSLQLDVDGGTYYIYDVRKTSNASSPITFTYWNRDGVGGWTKTDGQTAIDSDGYDDGSGTIINVPAGQFKGDLLYLADNDGAGTTFHCIYAQETFLTSGAVISNPIVPDIISNNALRVARIIVERGGADIVSIVDQRPKLGQLASGSTAITRHGDMTGLSANDHTQYQLRTEKNQASGYCGLDAGTKVSYTYLPFTSTAPSQITVTSAVIGSSNQICFSDHAHSVSTATASGLTVGGSSAEGSATSLCRSDHNHGLAAFGTTSGTFCQGNDSRLSDDRTASGLRSATTIVSISSATAPSAGQVLKATSSTAATWQTDNTPPLSDTAPVNVLVQTAAAGASTEASRRDHAHDVSVGSPVSVGTANADGAGTSLARSNHVHSGLTRGANDFSAFTLKSALASADIILLEDSAASGVKKYTTVASFHGDFTNGGDVAVAARSLGNNSAYDLYLRTNSANVVQVTSSGTLRVLGAAGYLYSERYIMGSGPDLSCIPVVGGQSVITTWWGLQLVGNKQSNVEYTPTNYGAASDFSVIIPNQQAASIGLVIQGQTAQTGDLVRWRNSSSTVLSKVTPDGLIVAPNINNCRRVRVATTIAITLTGAQTIDFVSVVAGDLVLVKDQGTGSQNGIYVCAAGAWAYASDWQTGFVFAETYVSVSDGVANGHTMWRVNNTGAITVGTTAIVFTRTFMSRDAGDINSFTGKTTVVGSDILLIEDSEAAYVKKKILLSYLPKKWPFSKVLTVDATNTNADYTTIQAAINAASAGMTILINPGTYAETISLKDGVDLMGAGGSGVGYSTTATSGVWIYRSMTTNTDLVTLSSGSCSINNINIKLERSGSTPTLRAIVCGGTKLQLNNCHIEVAGGAFPNSCSFTTIQVTAGELVIINSDVVASAEYVGQTLDYGLYVSGASTVNLHNSRFTPDVSNTSQSNIYINNASAVVNMNGCYVQGDCVRTSGALNLFGGNQMDYGVSADPIDGTGAAFKQWDAVRIDGSNEQYKLNLKTVTGDIGSPANGDVWYNNTTGKFRGHEGGTSYDLISSTSVFGQGYTYASTDARTTTTSSTYQTRTTLTTPATAGTYMVMFSCVLDNANGQIGWARLYNNTDAVTLFESNHRPTNAAVDASINGFAQITVSGSAKTIYLQYRSGTTGDTTGIAYARAQIWRVA